MFPIKEDITATAGSWSYFRADKIIYSEDVAPWAVTRRFVPYSLVVRGG